MTIMARSSPTSVLKDLLTELRLWRSSPSRRERILSRPPDREIPDPTPIEIPLGYERPATLAELVQTFVRQEVSHAAHAQGLGTFEEEDDFDVDDPDELAFSPYELTELQMEEEYILEDASSPDNPIDPPEPAQELSDGAPAPPEPQG